MTRRPSSPHRLRLAALLFLLAAAAPAQDPPQLTTQDLAEYLGTWTLTSSFEGVPIELTLEIVELEGAPRAALSTPMRPEPQLVQAITRSGEAIDFAYDVDFPGGSAKVHLKATLAEGTLSGSFGDEGGFFKADFTGVRAGEPAGIVAAALTAGSDQPRAQRRRRFGGSSQAELDLGGKNVRFLYGSLKVGTPDHAGLLATADGQVFEYPGSRCFKLFTDTDLYFSETKIAAHNLTPGYPGVYGLWLKKAGDGWRLVFNQQGDVWGTMHDPTKDVAEIPLAVTKLDAPAEELAVELAQEGDGGVLRIAWGDTAWSARFRTQQ